MSSTITSAATPIGEQTRPAYKLPSASNVFSNLLKADLTAQWRNRRASIMVVLIPSIILVSWKGLAARMGDAFGPFALSNGIAIGLNAIGLMGYTNAMARDREKGIFQRLRITPAPRWTIIASRLAVQLVMIMITAILLFIVGYQFDHITLKASGYVFGFLISIIGGAVYLSLGQMIVGLVKTQEAVNVTTRLVFFLFIMVGQLASFNVFPHDITAITNWSPYGTTRNILAAAFTPNGWTHQSTMYLLASLGYTIVFTVFGIRYFRWNTK
jgi:ABC-2 type transport system permease protein